MFLGRLADAEACYQEALMLAQEPALADAYHKANMNLAVLETDIGRYESARLRLTQPTIYSVPTLLSTANLGLLALETDDIEAAIGAAVELRNRCRTLNAPVVLAAAATLTGLAAWQHQDYGLAQTEASVVAGLIDRIPFHSDDSYARILMARVQGRSSPQAACAILSRQLQRAAVPQLRIELEYAAHLGRFDPGSAQALLKSLAERAERMGAAPVAIRAMSSLDALA